MSCCEFTVKKVLMGSIDKGKDLLLALKELAKEQNILAGRIEILGCVSEAMVGYFNNKSRKIDFVKYRDFMNIVSCTGTITEKEGEPFIHLHMALSDHEGQMFGGHLAEGTIVYSAEFTIAVYEGNRAVRSFDPDLGIHHL